MRQPCKMYQYHVTLYCLSLPGNTYISDYFSSPSISLNSSCWEDFNFIQYIRSQRLECYCKDSYGLFKNDNMEFENRQAACSLPSLEKELEKCGDWRLEEFFRNEEESRDVCFRQRTRVQLDGSGECGCGNV